MALNAGSVVAEATLDISKYKAAAAEMGADGEKIVNAMEKAAAGLQKAQGQLNEYGLSLEAAEAKMSAAQSTMDQSVASLQDIQAQLDAARASTDAYAEAIEKAAAKGDIDAQSFANFQFDAALNDAEALEQELEKQKAVVNKNTTAFKQAAAAVERYRNKQAAAQGDVSRLTDEMREMGDELLKGTENAVSATTEGAAAATDSASELSGVLGGMLSKTATSATEKIGTLGAKMLGLDTATASGTLAAKSITTGLREMISAAGATSLGIGAVAAAVGYGLYKWYDYASGAAAARESLEQLTEAAKNWEETNVTTSFEKSEGLKRYGLSEGDFGPKNKSGKDWVAETIKTWTDGAKESDEILKAAVEGFTSGSKEIRESLGDLQTTATAAGVSDVLGLDADLDRLDKIDETVEKLLKKRQNGFLTEDEKGQLQSLYDEREALAVKYHLVPDGTSGFDEIVQSAEAALRRGESGSTVWADAYTAASQGQAAFIDGLNAEYDARYKVIDLMEEGAEKQAALADLDTWYNEQNTAGIEAYKNALQSVATELTGAFEENGTYADTTAQLATAVEAMNAASKDPSPENMQAFTDALAGLDETQVVEMAASLTAMQAAGVEMSEGMTTALESLEALKGAADTDAFKGMEELSAALESMFGENLDSEVHELNVSLNTENLNTVYDAWAAGDHAPINANIGEIDAAEIVISGTVGLNGEVLSVTTKLGNNYTIEGFTVGVNGELIGVDSKSGENYTVPGLRVGVNGELIGVDPKSGEEFVVEGVSVEGDLVKLNTAEGAYNLSGVTAQVDGEIISLTLADGVTAPTIEVEANVTKVNFEQGKFSNSANPQLDYNAGAAGMNANAGEWGGIRSSDAEKLHRFAEAIRDYNRAVSEGNATEAEHFAQTLQTYGSDTFASLDQAGRIGTGFEDMAASIANGLQLLASGDLDPTQAEAIRTELTGLVADLSTLAESGDIDMSGFAAAISQKMAEAFSSDAMSIGWEGVDFSNLGDTLASAMAAVDFSSAGRSAGEGIGKGLAAADVSGDAQTFVANARAAVGAAEGEGSPAALFVPAGVSAAEGFGLGMRTADVSADARAMVDAALNAARANLSGATSIGRSFSAGLAAGISAGRSGVIAAAAAVASAAAAAARSKLAIHSPSRVTRELGEFFDLGFIRGVEDMTPDIRDAVRSAVYVEPPAGVAYGAGRERMADVRVTGPAMDYEALADAMRQMQLVFTMHDRRMAEALSEETARAQSLRNRSIALGYGRR